MTARSRPKSRTRQAYDLLRHDILGGALPPGHKLMLADLQTRYDLGSMPLREALNRLAAERLVDKHEQRGFTVPEVNIDSYVAIQNARIAVEAVALRQSIAAGDQDWEDTVVVAFHHLRKAGPKPGADSHDFLMTEEWSAAHGRFHRTLLIGCGNPWIMSFVDTLYDQSALYRMLRRHRSSQQLPARASLIDEHEAIMESALARDTETAVARLVEHYSLSVRIVTGRPVHLDRETLKLTVGEAEAAASSLRKSG